MSRIHPPSISSEVYLTPEPFLTCLRVRPFAASDEPVKPYLCVKHPSSFSSSSPSISPDGLDAVPPPASSREDGDVVGVVRRLLHISESRELHDKSDGSSRRLGPRRKNAFSFSRVFDVGCSTEAVFHSTARRLVEGLLKGIDGTIMLYGQTGSGKTHTVSGLRDCAIDYLFDLIRNEAAVDIPEKKFLVQCSMYEVYRERIFDPLRFMQEGEPRWQRPQHTIRQLPAGEIVIVPPLNCICAGSEDDARRVFQSGLHQIVMEHTSMGSISSRGTTVSRIRVESVLEREDAGRSRVGTLTIVDLAGNERIRGPRLSALREARRINQSLMSLRSVMKALVLKKRHVPFRDSKLTRLLQPSIINARMVWIGTVRPTIPNFDDTVSTIRFIEFLRPLESRPTVNFVESDCSAIMQLLLGQPSWTSFRHRNFVGTQDFVGCPTLKREEQRRRPVWAKYHGDDVDDGYEGGKVINPLENARRCILGGFGLFMEQRNERLRFILRCLPSFSGRFRCRIVDSGVTIFVIAGLL